MKSRTAIISGIKETRIIERTLDPINENEVLVKVLACNLCTSEYGVWSGKRSNRDLPWGFGHEWSGKVIEAGDKVIGFKKDDFVAGSYEFNSGSRVSLLSFTQGDPDKQGAFKKQKDGLIGQAGCAEYIILPQQSLHKLNKAITPSEGAFLEPVATVYAGIKRLKITPGCNVIVIGAGTMGILNAEIAKFCGARVAITEVLEKKIKTATSMGYPVFNPQDSDFKQQISEFTDGEGADIVIVAVGVESANKQAFEIVKHLGGQVAMFAAGYPDPELGIATNEIHYRRLDILGIFNADFIDFYTSAKILNTARINLKPLIEEKFKFDDIQAAFEAANVPGAYRMSVIIDEEADKHWSPTMD